MTTDFSLFKNSQPFSFVYGKKKSRNFFFFVFFSLLNSAHCTLMIILFGTELFYHFEWENFHFFLFKLDFYIREFLRWGHLAFRQWKTIQVTTSIFYHCLFHIYTCLLTNNFTLAPIIIGFFYLKNSLFIIELLSKIKEGFVFFLFSGTSLAFKCVLTFSFI